MNNPMMNLFLIENEIIRFITLNKLINNQLYTVFVAIITITFQIWKPHLRGLGNPWKQNAETKSIMLIQEVLLEEQI